jgi:quercetin dioxygenase-like cupin family protein
MSSLAAPRIDSEPNVLTGECRIESLVRRGSEAKFTDEYNCKLFRLFPWPELVQTRRPLTEFGATWVVLESGKRVVLHDHDEEETFVAISGSAELIVGNQSTQLHAGDVAYIPRSVPHSLVNHAEKSPFVFIDIYWDLGGQSA